MTLAPLRRFAALATVLLIGSACGSSGEATDSNTDPDGATAPQASEQSERAEGLSNNPAAWVLEAIGPAAADGDVVSLADQIGKPLVITFFGPNEASDSDLAGKLSVAGDVGQEVSFIGIWLGEAEEIAATIERSGIGGWTLAADSEEDGLLAAMNASGTPITAFYDSTGEFLGIQGSPIDELTLRSALFQLFAIGEAPPTPPADYAGFRAQPTACGSAQPYPVEILTFEAAESQGLNGTINAILSTSCGDIELTLDVETYPETVNSFVFLARAGYYDGIVCHRLVSGFVLQCGDQTATGTSGPGYTVPDEFPEDGFVYEQGVVAMANAGAGTTGSQFFIIIGDGSFLDNTFSILGTVVGSEEALAALTAVPLGLSARGEPSVPLETIYLNSVEIGE